MVLGKWLSTNKIVTLSEGLVYYFLSSESKCSLNYIRIHLTKKILTFDCYEKIPHYFYLARFLPLCILKVVVDKKNGLSQY